MHTLRATLFAILIAQPTILKADSGFFAPNTYRVPSSVEQSGNSVVKMLMLDYETGIPRSSGSGFVVDDSRTIWTAAHVVREPKKEGQTIPLRLYDTVGNKIFDTTAGDVATVSLLGSSALNLAPGESDDYAKITLSRPLNLRPITINSTKPPSIGEDLYSVGYPALDSIEAPTHQSIVQGISQARVTTGKAITMSELNEKVAPVRAPASEPNMVDKVMATKMIFIDADGYFGQSGSPILNDSGEAVGIFTAIIRTREVGPGEQINTKSLGPNFYGILTP